MYYIYTFGDIGSVLCREVVPFSEGLLLEVPLYTIHDTELLIVLHNTDLLIVLDDTELLIVLLN